MTTHPTLTRFSTLAKRWLCSGSLWVLGLSACDSVNERFTGVWVFSDSATPTRDWLGGEVILALGHYGPDLTGVVHFRDSDGLPLADCSCAYLDSLRVDAGNGRFSVSSDACRTTLKAIWQFTIDDEDEPAQLEGTVYLSGQSETSTTSLGLIRQQELVGEEWRECSP